MRFSHAVALSWFVSVVFLRELIDLCLRNHRCTLFTASAYLISVTFEKTVQSLSANTVTVLDFP